MHNRQKILILENDDFLREIIGNLLHKQGGYILNGASIQEGLDKTEKHTIDTVILGTSCSEYKGKETLKYINKQLNQQVPANFYLINDTEKSLEFVPKNKQIHIEHLSIEKILEAIPV